MDSDTDGSGFEHDMTPGNMGCRQQSASGNANAPSHNESEGGSLLDTKPAAKVSATAARYERDEFGGSGEGFDYESDGDDPPPKKRCQASREKVGGEKGAELIRRYQRTMLW